MRFRWVEWGTGLRVALVDAKGSVDRMCDLLTRRGFTEVEAVIQDWSRETRPATYMLYARRR